MKISFPLHNGVFEFDGTYEEYENLFNTPLTIDDIDEAIDNIRKAIDDKSHSDPIELFKLYAAKEGKNL